MALTKYALGGAFVNQPSFASVARTMDVVMAGVGEDDQTPKRWTVADSLRDNYLAKFREASCSHAIVSTETDTSDDPMRRLGEAAAYLSSQGITTWWYQPWVDGDAECAKWKEHDPARYSAWRAARKAMKRPVGCNIAFDIYQWKTNSAESWLANRLELMRVYREDYPDARILPIVWHRENVSYDLVSPEFFRAMVRVAVMAVGRVVWWLDPVLDAERAWDPATEPYQKAFCEEAGVVA